MTDLQATLEPSPPNVPAQPVTVLGFLVSEFDNQYSNHIAGDIDLQTATTEYDDVNSFVWYRVAQPPPDTLELTATPVQAPPDIRADTVPVLAFEVAAPAAQSFNHPGISGAVVDKETEYDTVSSFAWYELAQTETPDKPTPARRRGNWLNTRQ